ITGSHNFSASASGKNDENLIIIRNNPGLAERYAVNIMSNYQHYRWRAYLQEAAQNHQSPWEGLEKDDHWQQKGPSRQSEIDFWVRK
ncbi:MAG: hypothetical protein J7578_23045, partial [Chitinophagaceae bacterium]|nr:hypothetical protein [Chitinophagaceae bacterium]